MKSLNLLYGTFTILFAAVMPPESSLQAAASDETPGVEEIVEKANKMAFYQGSDGKAEVRMTIRDAQGNFRRRRFTMLRRDVEDGGDQKFYVYFDSPSDVKGMVFMVWKHTKTDDDRWLYLPSLDLVKRITATDKRTSFVGSHYFYEDVSGRNIKADTHKLIETTDKFYMLENIPKKPDNVEFTKYNIWIDRKTFLPMKSEYYNRQGKKYRVIKVMKTATIQGKPTVVKAMVEDLDSKGATLIEFRGIKYDIDIPDTIFTERYLRRKPAQYID